MKLKILSSAIEDLSEGRLFYDKQGEGLGEYFYLLHTKNGQSSKKKLF